MHRIQGEKSTSNLSMKISGSLFGSRRQNVGDLAKILQNLLLFIKDTDKGKEANYYA